MSGEHASFAPSSMSRIVSCPGSWKLSKPYLALEDESEAAKEGTAAHWVLSEAYAGRTVEVDSEAPNGVAVTEEMLDGAEMVLAHFPPAEGSKVEQQLDCSVLHPDCWGTPDYWKFDEKRGVLKLLDYKFGHRFVPVFENWQLLSYAAGALAELGIDGIKDQHIQVWLHVIQPRSYHRDGPVRTWSPLASLLRGYFNRIRTACEDALQPGVKCTPSPECDYCPGRRACEAVQSAGMAAVEYSKSNTPHDLLPEEAGKELRLVTRAIERLQARKSGLEEQVYAALSSGRAIPRFALQPSTGRKTWAVPIPEVLALGSGLGVSLEKPGVITPIQAVKKGIPEEVIEAFAKQESKGLKLVEVDESDLRKAFQ